MLLFNHSTDGAKKFEVLIGNGKQLWTNTYLLAPMETKAVRINEIVEQQVKDAKGKVLSKEIRAGQVGWYTHRATWGKGRLMVSQPQTGLARSFSCGNCIGLCSQAILNPTGSAVIGVGGVGSLGDATFQSCLSTCKCGGTPQGPVDEIPTWSSSNTAIATGRGRGLQGNFTGVSPGLAYGNFQATDEGCTATGSGPITVCQAVPTSATTTLTDPLSLSSVFPSDLSGVGDVARVTAGPSGSTWDGQTVTETVAAGTSTCPSAMPTTCSGNSTFTIGAGYQPSVCTAWNGANCTTSTPIGPLLVGTTNEFFDQYGYVANLSVLDYYGAGSSCQQTCTQTYLNACTPPQPMFSHTFTRTFTKSTISGTKVTLVTVSE